MEITPKNIVRDCPLRIPKVTIKLTKNIDSARGDRSGLVDLFSRVLESDLTYLNT